MHIKNFEGLKPLNPNLLGVPFLHSYVFNVKLHYESQELRADSNYFNKIGFN